MKKRLFVLPLLLFSFLMASCDDVVAPIIDENGNYCIQTSSSSFENINYEDALDKLVNAGFINYTVNFEGDLITGWLTSEYSVDKISVGGKEKFSKNEYFAQDSLIMLYVHSFKETSFSFTIDSSNPPCNFSSKTYKNKDKFEVGEDLKNKGFTNIVYIAISDVIFSSSSNEGKVDKVLVNGNELYCKYSNIDKDSKIEIYYHTYETNLCTNGLAHNIVQDAAIPSTCTEHGKTAGSHCSNCGKIISGCEELPLAEHTKVIDIPAVPATCTSTGFSEQSHCSVCNEILSERKETPKDYQNHTDHTELEEVRPTYQNNGYNGRVVCNDCGTVIDEGTPIKWAGSKEENEIKKQLNEYFPLTVALKVIKVILTNYLAPDVFDASGSYPLYSKFHDCYYNGKYSMSQTSMGTWVAVTTDTWHVEDIVFKGGQYNLSYHIYAYVTYTGSYYYAYNATNGESDPNRKVYYEFNSSSYHIYSNLIDSDPQT